MYPALLAHLEYHGLTQVDLANAAGITPTALNRIIRGRLIPSRPLMSRIADILDRDVGELWQVHPFIERMVQSAVEQGYARDAVDPIALRNIAAIAATPMPDHLANAILVPLPDVPAPPAGPRSVDRAAGGHTGADATASSPDSITPESAPVT